MSKKINRILANHLSGEASTDECGLLVQWLYSSKKHREEYDKIALIFKHTKGKGDSDPGKIFENLLLKTTSHGNNGNQNNNNNNTCKFITGVAASMLIALIMRKCFELAGNFLSDFSLKENKMTTILNYPKI
ncbi:MAG: hypothetical protein OEW75_07565 [Cyclobacteriaceae bacterium]|nr:hypothetical protein [Cyclobacteriaceae bacterium]